MQLKEIIYLLNQMAPPALAAPGDNVGLQIGDPQKKVKKILVCLTLTRENLETAISQKVDLIVAHHLLIFAPIGRIDFSTPTGEFINQLIKNNLAFFGAHTNLDAAPGGVNDQLAVLVGLEPKKCQVLWPTYQEKLFKLVVFVPHNFTDKVRQAITSAGAGWLGKYDFCSFITEGVGTFRPLKGTNPFMGRAGQIEKVKEDRLETTVSEFILEKVFSALKKAHPYEEIAFDLYPLVNPGRIFGLGRVGKLIKPVALKEFLKNIQKKFKKIDFYAAKKSANFLNSKIQTIAVGSGSGSRLMESVRKSGPQIFLTGELKYHEILEAVHSGISVITAGHEATEKMMMPILANYLKEKTNLSIITKA